MQVYKNRPGAQSPPSRARRAIAAVLGAGVVSTTIMTGLVSSGAADNAPAAAAFTVTAEATLVPRTGSTDVTDTATITGDVPEGAVLSFEAFLQPGPHPTCTDPAFSTVYGVIDGPGVYTSADSGFNTAQTYFWVETLTGADGVILHQGECGAVGQTTFARRPSPQKDYTWLRTQATPSAVLGQPATDTAYVIPLGNSNTLTDVSLSFEAFRQDGDTPTCTTPAFSAVYGDIVFGEPGVYESPEVVFGTPGTYFWIATLTTSDGTIFGQDECGAPGETTIVSEAPVVAVPVAVTTTATPAAELGQPARDTAVVTGDVPEGAVLSFEAFLQGTDGAICTTPVFSTSYGVIDAAGTYESAETVFEAAGTYYWVETLTGADGTVLHKGDCGALGETTVVTDAPVVPVTVTTQATPSVVEGAVAHDVARVTGTVPEGTILSFEAFLQATDTPICTDPIFSTIYGQISGNGYYTSEGTVLPLGTTFWVETLTGPDGTVLHKGDCGALGETTVVTEVPVVAVPVAVTTTATPAVELGQGARDTAVVTGDVPEGAVLSFEAFLQGTDGAICTTPVFSTSYGVIDAAGTYESAETVFEAAGTYYWVETLTGADGTVLHKGDCGALGETTVVTEVPVVAVPVAVTTAATPAVELGQGARDTAVVTGDVPEGSVLSFEAFLQGTDGAICTTPVFSTSYGVIDAAGTYESAETVFEAAGTYYWVETLTGADGTVLHKGDCGALGETTVVTEASVEPTVEPTATPVVDLPVTYVPADPGNQGTANTGGTGGTGGALAITGADATALIAGASALLALGAGFFAVGRRRGGKHQV